MRAIAPQVKVMVMVMGWGSFRVEPRLMIVLAGKLLPGFVVAYLI